MKRLIPVLFICLLLVGCNSAKSLDGSYYAINSVSKQTLEIEGNTVLITTEMGSDIGTLDTKAGTVTIKREDEEDIVWDFAVVGDKIKVGGHTYVKGEYTPEEENEEEEGEQEESAEDSEDSEDSDEDDSIEDIYDLEDHTFENKSKKLTMDFYTDDDTFKTCVLFTSDNGDYTGVLDEDNGTIKWDDGGKGEVSVVNGKLVYKEDGITTTYELKK